MSGDSRKEKKKRILERNKRHNLINLMAQQHEGVGEGGGLSAPEYDIEKAREDAREKKKEEQVWADMVQGKRNALTLKRTEAKERWNRFAGTEGSMGGRGL